jgi:hypothetical protein
LVHLSTKIGCRPYLALLDVRAIPSSDGFRENVHDFDEGSEGVLALNVEEWLINGVSGRSSSGWEEDGIDITCKISLNDRMNHIAGVEGRKEVELMSLQRAGSAATDV